MAENTTKVEEKETKLLKQEKYKHEGTGIEYTFQFPGVKRTQEILDESKKNGSFSNAVYHELLMEEVIAHPQTNWDYWDEHDGYMEVLDKADRFLGGLLFR